MSNDPDPTPAQREKTVFEIIAKYLGDNCFDGLYCHDCGCELGDLMSVQCDPVDCRPGYKHSLPCKDCDRKCGDEDFVFAICPIPKKESTPCPK